MVGTFVRYSEAFKRQVVSELEGGKFDSIYTLQGEKFGLNKGFTALMHVESSVGNTVNADAGALGDLGHCDCGEALFGKDLRRGLQDEWAFLSPGCGW